MDCREAKRRLNNPELLPDEELLKHLENCPDCNREADAAKLLNEAFLSAEDDLNIETTPLTFIRSKIENSNIISTKKERGIMAQIKDQARRRPKLTAGFVLTFAAFLFITLVPFSYTKIVGYEIAFSNVGDLENDQLMKINKGIMALGYDDVSIEANRSGITVSKLSSRLAAAEVLILVNSIVENAINSRIQTVTEKVSGSLYAQALDKRKTIEINAKDKTTDEIKDEIKRKLIAEGFTDPEIAIRKEGDSIIDVRIKISDSTENKMQKGALELKISADTDSFELPVMERSSEELDIDMEGKTDAEIKAAIEEKLAREGKEGATVEVITTPDGEREIKVKLEKEVIK